MKFRDYLPTAGQTLQLLVGALMLAAGVALAQNTFRIMPDSGGAFPSYLRLTPSYVDARVLAAGVNESHTVPATATRVVFSANCTFYARPGGTAAVPAADVTDGTASEMNPSGWHLTGETAIGLIAPTACIVTMSWYAK